MIWPGTLAIPYFDGQRSGTSEAMVTLADDGTFCTVTSIEVGWSWCVKRHDVQLKQYVSTHVAEHACRI